MRYNKESTDFDLCNKNLEWKVEVQCQIIKMYS